MNRFVLALLVLVACAGPVGPEGPIGPRGQVGAAGAPGAAGINVSAVKNCSTVQGDYLYFYEWVLYTTGDVWTTCQLSDGANTYSALYFHRAGTAGASPRSCAVVFDVNPPYTNFGSWLFSLNPVERVQYNDPGGPSDGYNYVFLTTECQ